MGPQGETVYVNQFFVIRGGAVGTKHVFAGSTRMVTKLAKQENPTIKSNNAGGGGKDKGPRERDMYFYHPDHLGSSSYVTDEGGRVFQHLEYFPFGETWVEEKSNTQRTPYLFTGKELDEDTGLYYFGARYYDQRTSVWASVDPILDKYLPTGNKEKDGKLPGMGGVFNTTNLNLYHYAGLNPVKYLDPDGRVVVLDDALVALSLYVEAVLASPDLQMDLQMMSMDVAEGDIPSIICDAIGIAIPGAPATGVKGAYKISEKLIGEYGPKIGNWALKQLNRLPGQIHHIAAWQNKQFTPAMKKIAGEFGLGLNQAWNKIRILTHKGPHAKQYHEFVLKGMQQAYKEAGNNPQKFFEKFQEYVVKPLLNNPDLLKKSGWE